MEFGKRDNALPPLLVALHRLVRGLTYRLVIIEARTTEVGVELERRLKFREPWSTQSLPHVKNLTWVLNGA